MFERFVTYLGEMTPRERWLLAIVFGLVIPLAIVFLWLLPLAKSKTAASTQAVVAHILHQWVLDRGVEYTALARLGDETTITNTVPVGISGVEESLKRANLRQFATQLTGRDAGGVEMHFEDVAFSELANWLSIAERNWGYTISRYRFERTAETGFVAAEFLLHPAAP